MKKARILIVLFFMINLLNAQDFNQLNKYFDVLFDNHKMMGSISIFKNGAHIYEKSVGYQFITDTEEKLSSSTSKYRIGSVTKTFTAVMLFQLIDEGKLSLDTALSAYYPNIDNAKRIKIRHLLNHSSGLYNITNEADFNRWMLAPSNHDQMLDRIYRHKVDFQPGEKHEYSNTNFLLLGYIMESIENKSYADILRQRITLPLNLTHTYYGGEIDTNSEECLSYTYMENENLEEAKQTDMSNPGGAGAIVSNPTDLTTFITALFNNKLMSTESFKIMTTISGEEYGSGILFGKKGDLSLFAHSGSIDRFNSMLLYIPKLKTAIALNTNAINYSMMPIMFNAIAAVMGDEVSIPNFGTVKLSPETVKQYAGIYQCEELPFNLEFIADGSSLKGAPEGENLKVLNTIKEDEFTLDTMGIVLKFNRNNNTLHFEQAGETPKKCTKK